MKNNKIFIIIGDGVGLKNFAYSSFSEIGKKQGFEIVYWNNTHFDLETMGFSEIKIKNSKLHPLTGIYKNALIQIQLNLFIRNTKDKVYNDYRFPFSYKTIKSIFKNSLTKILILTHSYRVGLNSVRRKIKQAEQKTLYYHECLETLKKEKPDIVFSTNQRLSTSIAPLLAAQDLGIPTATFIFSWDNLPKATMVVETDYYYVWSVHMKKELLFYYPYIHESQVFVTGTPQFESHFDTNKILSKNDFFSQNKLDSCKKYICYSGDDVTTCPDDPQYLLDVAEAVRLLNSQGYLLGIIFRRCPVDFSNRFDKVLEDYKDIIISIEPLWEKIGGEWNSVLPTQSDIDLQMNTIHHTDMVINLGSSMVFDYIAHTKPCAFINYDVMNKKNEDWSVKKIYNFVHFRSMPSNESVIWLNSANEIAEKILIGLHNPVNIILNAQNWFDKINQQPAHLASERIWNSIKEIRKK